MAEREASARCVDLWHDAAGMPRLCDGCYGEIAPHEDGLVLNGSESRAYWHADCLALLPARLANPFDALGDSYEADANDALERAEHAHGAASHIRRVLRRQRAAS